MSRRALSRGTVFLAACALVLTACTGGSGDGGDSEPKSESEPEALKPEWTATMPAGTSRVPELHVTPNDRVYYASASTVGAYDAKSGRQLWSRVVKDACRSSEPNAAGDVAVSAGEQCRDVAVIDGQTGKVRWRTHIPSVSPGYDSGDVVASIGNKTVTVVQFCGQVTRLALRDGKRIGVLAPHDRACANEADSDGRLIALWHDPETADTPDDHGTGWIPSWEGKAAFELYDADTGKRLWRRGVDRQAGALEEGAVVNTDPVVLALTDDHHKTMRTYTRKSPKPGPRFGRQMDSGDTFTPIGTADGVLIGTYGDNPEPGKQGPRVFAYELDSGRELWSRAYPAGQVATVAGVDSRGVVITQGQNVTDPDPDATFRTWVSRWDLRSGEDAGVAGRIDDEDRSSGASVWSVADGTLYRAHHDPTTATEIGAYELPDPDPDRTAPEELEWADGDVQPDPFADPCTAVRPATLRQLGLRHSVELPAPADCVWRESDQPDRSDRALSVDLSIVDPTATGDDDEASESPAVENAKELVKQRREAFRPGFSGATDKPPMPEPSALDGVADEAYASAAEGTDATGAYLLVRQGNVVLEVRAEGAHQIASRGAGQASLPDTEAGVMAAAEDVFGELDLEFGAPETPDDDGRFERIKAVCDAMSDDFAALGLPDPVSVMPRGADARVARCASVEDRDYGAELEVYAYAAAASPLTEKTGKEAARAVYSNAKGSSDKPISTLGDKAAVYRDDSEYGGMSNSDRRVTTRRGNLVVQIDYSRWGAGIGPQMERDVIAMARKLIHLASEQTG